MSRHRNTHEPLILTYVYLPSDFVNETFCVKVYAKMVKVTGVIVKNRISIPLKYLLWKH
jgi:hypothetical protein